MVGIYKITNPINQIYIGKTKDINKRFREYQNLKCEKQPKIYNSLNIYGSENHDFEILEECELKNLRKREKFYINKFNSYKEGLNCNVGGGGVTSHSIETKEKISKSLTGMGRSEETKQKISQNHSSSKKIYQYSINGDLIKIWDSCSQTQRENKGNIKNNILGKTKHSNNFLWFREEDLHLLGERIKTLNGYQHPNKEKIVSDKTRELMSQNIKGKKTNYKSLYLLENIKSIKEEYKFLSTNALAIKYNTSIPTMLNFLKENQIYIFRKNYRKLQEIK